MKNNISEWLFNPFKRIAGYEAFFTGLFISLVTVVIGTFSGIAFDGVIDAHLGNDLTILKSFLYLVISVITLVLVMYFAGTFINTGFRFIDLLGTMTLARAPFLIIALAGFFAKSPELEEMIKNPVIIFHYTGFMVLIFLSLPILIWYIVLLYRAFKITTGANGTKLIAAFVVGLIVSEVLSKTFIFLLL